MTSSDADAVDRNLMLDAIRGFALWGIFVVNITAFASSWSFSGLADPVFTSTLDRTTRWLLAVLFTSKFYILFSFLFGYSFTLQMASASRAGASFAPRMLRRLAGLFAIGLAHAVLLFHGDILTTYACVGLILLWLRGLEPRRAVRIAVGLVLATAAFYIAVALLVVASGQPMFDAAAALARAEEAHRGFTGTAFETMRQNVRELPAMVLALGLVQGPAALAMFLLGLAAGKQRLLEPGRIPRDVLWRTLSICLPIGLAGAIAFASIGFSSMLVAVTLNALTAPPLAAAWTAACLLAFDTRSGVHLRTVLAPPGRMALSNYLLQSLICALIFTGYGLRLMDRLAPFTLFLLAGAIFGLQTVISTWWLRRYAYGPVEWLLRAITYARWPRWRVESRADAAV